MNNEDTPNRFYKKAIQGKKGNVFKRLDDLEAARKKEGVKDITNIIMSVVNNTEIDGVSETTPLNDGEYSGTYIDTVAGDALAFGNLVYLSAVDSRWELADASAEATSAGKLGICVFAAPADGYITKVLIRGNVRADAVFPVMTVGSAMYASITTGEISGTPPSANIGEIIRNIGHANTENELHFEPDNDYFEIGTPPDYGDVIGDSAPSVAGNATVYSDLTGKHIEDSGLFLHQTGASSIAIGNSATLVHVTGGNNIGIGSSALSATTSGQGNIAIGTAAGFYETGNYKLLIDYYGASPNATNEAEGRAHAIIYGTMDPDESLQELEIHASLKIGVGSNHADFDADGKLLLVGNAKYERHVQLDAMLTGNPSNQPTAVDFFTVGGLQFPTTGSKYAFTQWEIPDDWDGTDIIFEIDWFPDSGAMSGTDAVRWTVEYRAIETATAELINNGTSVTLSNGAGGDTSDYSQYQPKHSQFTMVFDNANQPLTKQDHIYFKISRDTGVANDFGGTVTVSAYEIIYNSQGLPTN